MPALVDDYDEFSGAVTLSEPGGWVLAPEPGDAERRKVGACYPDIASRTHHLHVVERRSTKWPDWLLFRDYLRSHDDRARAYAALKTRLAAADAHDRPAYRAAKAPFIEAVLRDARA
ncbi:GrpB family protein [Flexivirga oryzae]|uniref:GrpB-like predicted nucleotidyltransferase (UPF0157 family) n=1 Tax=Flexivirga oryzae TaxID=1794944 RepID=A0A839NAR5_9MICO|nr:GrpB family protein [Flexivirga oryzae]MBB2891811.1 GrpB-like predicted nucleotidyltransferase (UPF0157 family) [Flexivirga oryzae]